MCEEGILFEFIFGKDTVAYIRRGVFISDFLPSSRQIRAAVLFLPDIFFSSFDMRSWRLAFVI